MVNALQSSETWAYETQSIRRVFQFCVFASANVVCKGKVEIEVESQCLYGVDEVCSGPIMLELANKGNGSA